jgi:hypothetical protein
MHGGLFLNEKSDSDIIFREKLLKIDFQSEKWFFGESSVFQKHFLLSGRILI